MKRDMDVVRQIAHAAAELRSGHMLQSIDGMPAEVFAFHVALMDEAGLIKAAIQEYATNETPKAFVLRLTWDGCDFVDSTRDPTLWEKAKANVLKPTASFSFSLLREWLKEELRKGLPSLST